MTEERIYWDGDIEITRTMAKFGKTTYPIAGIGSVFIEEPKRIAGYIFAALLVLGGAVATQTAEGGGPGVAILLGLLIALVTYFRPFKLTLRTASGDQRALTSRKRKLIEDVKASIEHAVMSRG